MLDTFKIWIACCYYIAGHHTHQKNAFFIGLRSIYPGPISGISFQECGWLRPIMLLTINILENGIIKGINHTISENGLNKIICRISLFCA